MLIVRNSQKSFYYLSFTDFLCYTTMQDKLPIFRGRKHKLKRLHTKSFSIHTILMVAFSTVISTMIILIGTAVIVIMRTNMLGNSMDSAKQLISQSQFYLDNYFLSINSSLQYLVQDKSLVELCKYSSGDTDSNNLDNRKEVQQQILRLLQNQTDITNIIVLGDGFSVFHTDINQAPFIKSPLIQELQDNIKTQKYATTVYHPISLPTYYNTHSTEPEIPISLMVRDYSTYDTTNYGVLLASLRLETLNDFFAQMNQGRKVTAFITEKNGRIFYSNKPEYIGKTYRQYLNDCDVVSKNGSQLADASNHNILLEHSLPLELNDWNIILTTDLSVLNQQVFLMKVIVLICAIGALLITFLLNYFLTKRIIQPLQILSQQMEQTDDRSLTQKLNSHFSYKEINQLYTGYNHMLERIDTLINEVYYEHLRQKDAQYEALQAKINPHFLYNTLQSISSLAILGRNDDIELVTNALGGMLEYLTYQKSSQVSLAQELDYVKRYVQIQQLRYNNRFITAYKIEPDTLSCQISKLLLQTMIENSIKHGLEEKLTGGRLYIQTKLQDGLLIIRIEDNGIGMDEETLKKLIKHTNSPDKNSSQKSIGLSNIQERIHLKYGKQYGITIQSAVQQGTTITVVIPAVFSDHEEGHENEESFSS